MPILNFQISSSLEPVSIPQGKNLIYQSNVVYIVLCQRRIVRGDSMISTFLVPPVACGRRQFQFFAIFLINSAQYWVYSPILGNGFLQIQILKKSDCEVRLLPPEFSLWLARIDSKIRDSKYWPIRRRRRTKLRGMRGTPQSDFLKFGFVKIICHE